MKKLKILLPMLAFIFAIGMAFATTEPKEEPKILALDYYQENGIWKSVPEQNCGVGQFTCRVQFGTSGTSHILYDNMGDSEPKPSVSPEPIIL